jgi:hypothetical protein
MSSEQIKPQTELLAHIPVDNVDIVNGPAYPVWQQLMAELAHKPYVLAEFTLKTAASKQTFRRTLEVTEIFNDLGKLNEEGEYSSEFSAYFSGSRVIGLYGSDRTGWFSLNRLCIAGLPRPSTLPNTPR